MGGDTETTLVLALPFLLPAAACCGDR